MNKQVSIAIIGGGASGTITALHLLRKLNVPANIYLIEKRKEAIYRGNAYSSQLSYEPLNVPAGRMSLYNHLPDDFYYWLKSRKQPIAETEITKECFVSRRWFGDYMAERIKTATDLASHVLFETMNGEVNDIDFDSNVNAYCIHLTDNKEILTNYIIFATGNEPPADVFSASEIGSLNSTYISNPWNTNPLNGIDINDTVLIIGTGLTMVDHVVSLHKQRHNGKIFCFSRNGYLPLVHTEKTQNFVFELNTELNGLTTITSVIRKNIEVAGQSNIEWQNVLDAMRVKTSRIWKSMSLDSKQLFLKKSKSFWEIHRHRMPVASSITLTSMMQAGQLQILCGRSKSVTPENGAITFKYIAKGSPEENSITVQRIINCTGPSGDYMKTGNRLIKNMITKGWMQQDVLKLGITTGVRGEIIQKNGVVLQNAFSVGPLRKATEWESTAIREIRMQAEETASYISARIEKNHDVVMEIGL